MSETAPILIQVKQWCDNKWVIMEHFKTVTDDMQTRIQNMLILQTCPPSNTVGQQSGGSIGTGTAAGVGQEGTRLGRKGKD